MNKVVILALIGLLLVTISMMAYDNYKEEDYKEDKMFHGPVPLGYDQEHFWKTGEMIKEVKNNG